MVDIQWEKIGRHDIIEITDDYMEALGIPKHVPDNPDHANDVELWKWANFYRNKEWKHQKKYMVSTFGRVLNVKKGVLVAIGYSTGYSVTASGVSYRKVNIAMDGIQTVYYMHNLVAHTFLRPDDKRKNVVVDHIDENPSHNYIWNLQFVTRNENSNLHRMRMAQKFMDEGINITKSSDESLKQYFAPDGKIIDTRWTDDDIRHICRMIAEGHKATYIYNKLIEERPDDMKITYERIRTLYKHIMGKRRSFKEIAAECGVRYPDEMGINPYLKEQGSLDAMKS